MSIRWTVSVTVQQDGHPDETHELARLSRPLSNPSMGDFGLSLREGHAITNALQRIVAQSQVYAYDRALRHCPHCGSYRRIKDWRPRNFRTALGDIGLRVPRVRSCECLDEPMDEEGEILPEERQSECHIERLLPRRMTPELEYLCAKHGASVPYRAAARQIRRRSISGRMVCRRAQTRCGQTFAYCDR